MSSNIVQTVSFQYKYQLRGATLCVAFQVFAVSFIYLMSWNYKLLKNNLTPIFWAVLFMVALHGPKSSMVRYLCQYDKRLKKVIAPKLRYFKTWFIPSFVLILFFRIFFFWKPIFFDVRYHARRYSKTSRNIFEMLSEAEIDSTSPTSLKPELYSNIDKKCRDSSSALFAFSDDADDDDSDISDLSMGQSEIPLSSPKQIIKNKFNKMKISGSAKRMFNFSKWMASPSGLFCNVFIALSAVLLKSNIVNQLGLYAIFSNIFMILTVFLLIASIFVLIPAWSKSTYNTISVVFLILTLIGSSTLISSVCIVKIADETTRFLILVNSVVNNSEIIGNLEINSYVNATSQKVIESLSMHFDFDESVNWTETFSNLFGENEEFESKNASIIHVTLNETNSAELVIEGILNGQNEESLMSELSKIGSTEFDLIKIFRLCAKRIFGDHAGVNSFISLDFYKFFDILQEYGLDFAFFNKIFGKLKSLTSVIYGNFFGIIQLFMSFSSWIISLGLDFMVFVLSLFYLLVESDAVFDTIRCIASVIPSDDSIETTLSPLSNTHFLHSLFKSIQDIFICYFEIFLCHAFVTLLTFYMFDVDFIFVTSLLSGIFSIIPYFPPWIVCMHGVIYLFFVKHQMINALIMLVLHFALLWIDPILLERIENAHPYLTGTSIVLGLAQFGLNGAIIGPLLVCLTSWSLKVIAFYCKHFATISVDAVTEEHEEEDELIAYLKEEDVVLNAEQILIINGLNLTIRDFVNIDINSEDFKDLIKEMELSIGPRIKLKSAIIKLQKNERSSTVQCTKLEILTAMGFDEECAQNALNANDQNIKEAAAQLTKQNNDENADEIDIEFKENQNPNLQILTAMGFDSKRSIFALELCENDVTKAIETLTSEKSVFESAKLEKMTIALIGNSGVGKSSILTRFMDDTFDEQRVETLGVDHREKELNIIDTRFRLRVLDTAGQERFMSIASWYYRVSHAFIVVYDVSDRQSFLDLNVWLDKLIDRASDLAKRFVVGTKIDLHQQRQVSFEEAEAFADSKGFKYCEVSAKSGRNINQLFTTVALYVLRDNVVAKFSKNEKVKDRVKLEKYRIADEDRTENLSPNAPPLYQINEDDALYCRMNPDVKSKGCCK